MLPVNLISRLSMMKSVLAFLILLHAFSVSAKEPLKAKDIVPFRPVAETIYFPEMGAESEIEIGQTIVSKAKQVVHPALDVSSDLSVKVESGFFSNGWSGTASIKKGTFKRYFSNGEGVFYRADNATFSFAAGTVNQEGGVFVPNDANQPSLPWTFSKSVIYFGDTPVSASPTTIKTFETDSFVRELVYGGVSKGTIAISYREFSDKTARPAFTQELKYDLSEGDVIGFRGARFKIIKAGNVSLRYVVLKPLD
ncbi:MAG: hypothetical protein RLZZ237_377 [Pseudomonadota bacterium]|jgi:hypothetical protein